MGQELTLRHVETGRVIPIDAWTVIGRSDGYYRYREGDDRPRHRERLDREGQSLDPGPVTLDPQPAQGLDPAPEAEEEDQRHRGDQAGPRAVGL